MAKSFSPEYHAYLKSPEWRRKRRIVLAFTLHRDVIFPWLKASQIDHLRYWSKDGKDLLGREMPGLDVVPLHAGTHWIVTRLRDAGLKGPVNFVLRTAFAGWLSIWIYLGALVGQVVGIWRGVPLPSVDGFLRMRTDLVNGEAVARALAMHFVGWLVHAMSWA